MITQRTCLVIGYVWLLGLFVYAAEPVDTLDSNNPARFESDLIAKAHDLAKRGDENAADAQLVLAGSGPNVVPSVLLARRAMAVCGWLQNDNEYVRANKVAQRALERLAQMKEKNEEDRVERLYWEALLEGRILDHKKIALERLATAKRLSPDETRVLELEREFATEVARFGR